MRSALWREGVIRSWWVWSFALICFAVHETLAHVQANTHTELVSAIDAERSAIAHAQREQRELRRRLASVEDPAWQELVLMRVLGVVPDGQVKVYFQSRQESEAACQLY